ncbi:hypothetical protein MMC34_000889, partial [Xylographa carneopallida]|nr:hypothetical protein [Xylographa carneopallida]
MAPDRTSTVNWKQRSSERRRIASQKAREAREADIDESNDIESEMALDSNPLSIEKEDDTSTADLSGLIQKMRTEFAALGEMLTQQAREQVVTLQAQLDAQAQIIQKLSDENTMLKSESAALKAEITALAN